MRSWGHLWLRSPLAAHHAPWPAWVPHSQSTRMHRQQQTAAERAQSSSAQLEAQAGTMCAGLAGSGACSLMCPADACLPLIGALTSAWWLATCPHSSTQAGEQRKARQVQTGSSSSSRAGAAAAAGPTCFARISRSRTGVAARLWLCKSFWQAVNSSPDLRGLCGRCLRCRCRLSPASALLAVFTGRFCLPVDIGHHGTEMAYRWAVFLVAAGLLLSDDSRSKESL